MFGRQNANVRQVAVAFVVVEAVANDEFVGNDEAYIVSVDGSATAALLVEQGCDLQAARGAIEKKAAEELNCQSSVEDVFDEDDVLVAHRLIYIFIQTDFATRLLAAAVTGDADEVKSGVELNLPRQITEENGGALEHPDEHDRLASIVVRYLRGELGYASAI